MKVNTEKAKDKISKAKAEMKVNCAIILSELCLMDYVSNNADHLEKIAKMIDRLYDNYASLLAGCSELMFRDGTDLDALIKELKDDRNSK